MIRRAHRQESPAEVADLLRDPYVLEFTGLAERAEYAYPVALPSPKQLEEFVERDRAHIEAQMTKGHAS